MSIKRRAPGTATVSPAPCIVEFWTGSNKYSRSTYAAESLYTRKIGLDEVIQSQSGKDAKFRPVTHVKKHFVLSRSGVSSSPLIGERAGAVGDAQIRYYVVNNAFSRGHWFAYPQFLSRANTASVSLNSVQWAALADQAVQNMMPSIGGNDSLINFILELRDFRKLILAFQQNMMGKGGRLDWLRELLGGWQTLPKKAGRARATMRNLSKSYLAYKFGYEALYRDISQFIDSYFRMSERLSWLARHQNTPQQRYWATTLSGTADSGATLWSSTNAARPSSWAGDFQWNVQARVRRLPSPGIRYSATMRYRYAFTEDILSPLNRTKAWCDRFGIRKDPRIIWNAIPFSFVLDWLVGINGWLKGFKVDNLEPVVEILDFCHSAKVQNEIVLELCGNQYNANWSPTHRWLEYSEYDRCTVKAYERRVTTPNLRAISVSLGLSNQQLLLGGALLGSRRKTLSPMEKSTRG